MQPAYAARLCLCSPLTRRAPHGQSPRLTGRYRHPLLILVNLVATLVVSLLVRAALLPPLLPEAPTLQPDAATLQPDAPTLQPDAPTLQPDAPTLQPDAPRWARPSSTWTRRGTRSPASISQSCR